MPLKYLNDEISLFELKHDIINYSWKKFYSDIIAGLSVALLTFPQAIAYALLAGLPLQCGLFAAIYSSIIAALFGSSKHLVIGPSNAIAILVQAGTSVILYNYYRDLSPDQREIVAVQILTQITFVTALMQLLAAWCRLGRLTQFVSYSVIVGYITGVTLALVINQLYTLLGIAQLPGVHSLYENGFYLLTHLNLTQWTTAMVGTFSLISLIFLKRINSKIPVGLVTFAAATLFVQLFGLASDNGGSWLTHVLPADWEIPHVLLVKDTGEFYQLTPEVALPFFNVRIMNQVLPIACAIALLSIMETTAVAKSIATHSGQKLMVNQELFGLGLGNFVSSLIGGMPISGSPSRTAMNYHSGAQTRFATIFNALGVAVIVALLGFLVMQVPLAALAALLITSVAGLVQKKHFLLCMKATNADAFVLWITLLSCLFLSLDVAFYTGVTLSIILYLRKAAVPQLLECQIGDSGEIKRVEEALSTQEEGRLIRVIKVEGELFFGSADLFQSTLKTLSSQDDSTRVIILQLKNARDIDATTCLALQQLHQYLTKSSKHLVACGITPPIWDVFMNSGLVDQLGHNNLFIFDESYPHQHMQLALLHAKTLLNIVSEEKEEFVLQPVPVTPS